MVRVNGSDASARATPNADCTAGSATTNDHMPMLPIVPEYLNGRAYTIFGGSSEIQRDIVAKMVLGL